MVKLFFMNSVTDHRMDRFIKKLVGHAARVLDGVLCPPPNHVHCVNEYPSYYDPVYYPQFTGCCFDTPQNFCHWFRNALSLHHIVCPQCSQFIGYVFYDGVAIYVREDYGFVALSQHQIESVSYTHCSVLRLIQSCKLWSISLNERWSIQHHEFPCWFFYPVELYELHLSVLTFNILMLSARSLHLSYKGEKKEVVSIIASHALEYHVQLTGMSCQDLLHEVHALHDDVLLIPLLSSHFENLFGSYVAVVLCHPPGPVYSITESSVQLPLWATTLLHDDLLHCLNTLDFEHVVECIRCLPASGRPSINSCSHRKTMCGLLDHIIERARYLSSIPASILCDIVMATLPCESLDRLQGIVDCVACILEQEYGEKIIHTLTQTTLGSPRESSKAQRHEKKLLAVATRQQYVLNIHDNWPEKALLQSVILTCLNCYYNALQWRTPPVCAVCGQYKENLGAYDVDDTLVAKLE